MIPDLREKLSNVSLDVFTGWATFCYGCKDLPTDTFFTLEFSVLEML